MDNKTEYFTLKEDGVIGWIENMPEEFPHCTITDAYQQALQSPISNAKPVANQKDVALAILRSLHIGVKVSEKYFEEQLTRYLTVGTPYPLQCHVEKRTIQRHPNPDLWDLVALVTFPEPEKKQRYICLNCKAVHNFEPEKCPCCGRKTFHKTEANPPSGVEETQEITYEEYFEAIGANENNLYAQKVWQRLYHNGFMIVRKHTRKNK